MTLPEILPQIVVLLCFLGIIVIMFFDKRDYLAYSVLFMLGASLFSAIFIEEARHFEGYINAIEWKVIFFFIPMFMIIAILEPLFEEIASIVLQGRVSRNIRLLFVAVCVVATLSASLILALPTIVIFVPIVIRICRKMKADPAPFLLGVSICVNIAATLTPFGSAQNVLIYSHFRLTPIWFIQNLSPFFFIAFISTLVLLERTILRTKQTISGVASGEGFTKGPGEESGENNDPPSIPLTPQGSQAPKHPHSLHLPRVHPICPPGTMEHICEECGEPSGSLELSARKMTPRQLKLNLIILIVFFISLLIFQEIFVVALVGCVIFIFINPVRHSSGGGVRADMSHFISKINYKIIYFFMCLFIFAYLMEINGSLTALEGILENIANHHPFVICVEVLLLTSLLSGLLDNEPVTIIFLPIIDVIISNFESGAIASPIIVAFILGINLGGNFLPQGSSADLMNLEIAQQNGITGMNYKRLTKVGALFAVFHILLGIGYLAILVY